MPLATTRTSTSSASGAARSSVSISNGADRAGTTAAVIFICRLLKSLDDPFSMPGFGPGVHNRTGLVRPGAERGRSRLGVTSAIKGAAGWERRLSDPALLPCAGESPLGPANRRDASPMREPRNRVVQVRRFGGPDGLEVVDAPLPTAGRGEV